VDRLDVVLTREGAVDIGIGIGIGIPNSVRGTTGPQLLEWARRAEAAGFSTLGTIGRVAYPSYEELTVLATAGAVTERIGLMSNILLAPTRSTAEPAKQADSVHELTGGRLVLGVATGGRPDDYAITGQDFATRGRRFDEQLAELRRAFAGEPLADDSPPVVPDGARRADHDRRGVRRRRPADDRVRHRLDGGWRASAGGRPVRRARASGVAGRRPRGLPAHRGAELLRPGRHPGPVARLLLDYYGSWASTPG